MEIFDLAIAYIKKCDDILILIELQDEVYKRINELAEANDEDIQE